MPEPTPTDAPTVRRRIADVRATVVGTKGLRNRVAKHTTVLATLKTRLDDQQQRLGRQDQRLKDLEAKVKLLDRAITADTAERDRRDTQFGTIEVRLATLELRLDDARSGLSGDPGAGPDDEQLDAGRVLLDEVRTEHARIRARMQVVSAYEERLRRVEESVAELYEGDRRHLV